MVSGIYIYIYIIFLIIESKVKNSVEVVKVRKNVEVGVIGKGGTFGELALITNRPRAATIKVKDKDSHFATLSRQDYLIVLKKIEEKRIKNITAFFQSLPFFKMLTTRTIQKLQLFFHIEEYTRGRTVFQIGDQSENIYIVKSGEFAVSC